MSVFRPEAKVLFVSGELAKAVIVDTATGTSHPVMYNPEELKIEQGNDFAEVGIPGLDASPVQYVRGKTRVLTMELFFDSYERGQDVRIYTGPIVALLAKRLETGAPPILLFSLGRLQFRCVLVDASQRYTMFLRDGTPVRSTMSVRMQECVEVETDIRQGLFLGSSSTFAAADQARSPGGDLARPPPSVSVVVYVVVEGDTLSGLAGRYLGDPGRWREIADANQVLEPLALTPGMSLVIPTSAGGQG